MNAHIINVSDENLFLQTYLPNGYLGVGLVLSSFTPQALSNACKTSYSMYADMKTIREGDLIFVHAGQRIYGAYKAESEFMEDPVTNSIFHSLNLHYFPQPTIPQSGWQNNIPTIQQNAGNVADYRQMSISQFMDGEINFCFPQGIDSREVFDIRQKRKIFSVPEKWEYPDSRRTIRPLLTFEGWEIIKLLERQNSDELTRTTIAPKNLNGFLGIDFILNPNIVEDEKIIEGYICGNFGRNQNVDSSFGVFGSFGNNMPVPGGYTKMMDIFGLQEFSHNSKKFKIVEVKKGLCVFPDHISQLIGYMDLVTENIAGGQLKGVEGILVSGEFDADTISFVSNFNQFGRTIKLVRFDYNPPHFRSLNFNRVV